MSEPDKSQLKNPIAIVGMSAFFAEAQTPCRFWNNIVSGKDFIREVPNTHWLADDYYDAAGGPDKVYSCQGSFLPDIPFDPLRFGIPPNTIPSTDTAQLLALIAAEKVLRDAHVASDRVDPKRISVMLGLSAGTELMVPMAARIQKPKWLKALRQSNLPESQCQAICERIAGEFTPWVETTFPGLLSNVVAGRIANRLDLGGTNCTVDAACASSLASLKMAIDELRFKRSDLVIAGGVDAFNDIFMYMCFSQTTALSKSGHCRPFSDQADGTLMGEGIGLVALRRVEDAERDGDKIYALIHAVGSSSDGKVKSVYAPVAEGQASAIERAYAETPYPMSEVGLIEGHGTGTIAGDAAEFRGLQSAFANNPSALERRQFCALGSIKSQIGHTKSAAGIASLFKVVMALQQKVLPPSIKIDQPNPAFDIQNTPFYLNTYARPWIQPPDITRKTSVSSFGFGGSNFHVTLEEYPDSTQKTKPFPNLNIGALFLFGDESPPALSTMLSEMHQRIGSATLLYLGKKTQLDFNHQATYRCGFFAVNDLEAKHKIDQLLSLLANDVGTESRLEEVFFASTPPITARRTAFLFPGQGSQYLNMGADLCMEFPVAREVWDKFASVDCNDEKLHEVNFPIPVFSAAERQRQNARLTQTEWAQPAIGAVSLSQLALLHQLNVSAAYCAGHSYGEIPALYAAGVIRSPADLLAISTRRGELMAQCAQHSEGAMTAVFLGQPELESLLEEWQLSITIANINSPGQVVISGALEVTEQVEARLSERDIRFSRIPVSTAFHSEIVRDAVAPFADFLHRIQLSPPKCPVYANTTAQPYPSDTTRIYPVLAHQLAHPVRFFDQLQALSAQGVSLFIEVGPNNILSRFVSDSVPDANAIYLDDKRQNGVASFYRALGKMAVLGLPVAFSRLWDRFAEVENELDTHGYSKATIMINGSNYQDPYPPAGGAGALPPPNPEYASPQPVPVDNVASVVNPMNEKSTEHEPLQQDSGETPVDLKGEMADTGAPHFSREWLEAFQSLQQNMIDAQKSFQESLLQGHSQFMKVTESAIQQLGGNASGMSHTMESAPVHSSRLITDVTLPPSSSPGSMPTQPTASGVQAHGAHFATTTPDTSRQVPTPAAATTMAPPPNMDSPTVSAQPSSTQTQQAVMDMATLKAVTLQVIAEKTGYPEEMLEMDIDLESGLGIDSIKRVEILALLQEKIPALEQADAFELNKLNTLGEILAYAESQHGNDMAAMDTTVQAIVEKKN